MIELRALRSRSGRDAVSQSFNIQPQKKQTSLNYGNVFYNERMERVSIATVQQINDLAYYRRANRWVDSRLVQKESEIKPAKVIQFGSKEYIELAEKLAKQNRQGSIAFAGDILLLIDGEPVLIKMTVDN